MNNKPLIFFQYSIQTTDIDHIKQFQRIYFLLLAYHVKVAIKLLITNSPNTVKIHNKFIGDSIASKWHSMRCDPISTHLYAELYTFWYEPFNAHSTHTMDIIDDRKVNTSNEYVERK